MMNLQTITAVLFAVITSFLSVGATPAPTGLLCELLNNPSQTTIAHATPEFGWIVNSDFTNDTQIAYRNRLAVKR